MKALWKKIPNIEFYNYRYLGSVQVKGKKNFVKVFECFNAEPAEIIGMKQSTMKDFNAGLSSYLAKDFIVAAGHLKNVLSVNPNDVTAQRYFRMAAELMVKGVSPDWTGVEIMTEK